MNKWYQTAAVSGSGFEHLADTIVLLDELNNDILRNIDLLFIKDCADYYNKFRFYNHIALSESPIPKEEQEKFILQNPGINFLSRLGHDVINLFAPFEQHEYLEKNVLNERVEFGLRFGKQINIIGHLLQNSKIGKHEEMDPEDFIYNVKTLAQKKGITFKFNEDDTQRAKIIRCPEFIINIILEEIIENCKMHSEGVLNLKIDDFGNIVFCNTFEVATVKERAKARLRWPFMKGSQSKGSGLGLYILSVASVKGGFSWDIEIKENVFCLSLSF